MSHMMKGSLRLAFLGYVFAGVLALGLERAGVYGCGCAPDCWCKRPGLKVFRWVFPYGHHLEKSPAEKQRLGP
jgi:hypothetical protein